MIAYHIADRPKFTDPITSGARKMITPLGAAIVEALPDRDLVKYIKRRFKKQGQVPISSLFTAEQITAFYEQHDTEVKVVTRGRQPSKQKCPCVTQASPQCGTTCWHYGAGEICRTCENTGIAAAIRRDDTPPEGEQSNGK
jgi:hypothetical protein